MKINNNTSVPGIYKYTEGITVEYGDFVVFKGNLYVCITSQIDGYKIDNVNIDELDQKHFKTYLGGDKMEWEDFEKLYTGIEKTTDDKLITSPVLSKVLKRLMFGIDSSGIITEEVVSKLPYISPGIKEFIDSNLSPSAALEQLILSDAPEFNNLCIKVSRDLLKNYLPSVDSLGDDILFDSVILKHYTYRENANTIDSYPLRIRIQEVIDHINGVCLYRYVKLLDVTPSTEIIDFGEENIGKPSSWKISTVNLDYLSRLDAVLKYISDKENSKSIGESKFNFKDITIPQSTIDTTTNSKTYTFDKKFETDFENVTLTISVKDQENTKLRRNYSMTTNLYDKEIKYSFLPGITIERRNDTSVSIILTAPDDININRVDLINVYTKNYGNSWNSETKTGNN